MPTSKYNKEFGGKKGSAAKAKAAMAEEYGEKKGEQVFYATKNKHKSENERAEARLGKGARMAPKRG
jgi:hypothetical protein